MDRSTYAGRSLTVFLLALFAIIPIGCAEEAQEPAETATIAPATPEPNVDVDDDPALTQTIDPGENRSPYEGGPLEEDEVIGGEDPVSSTSTQDDMAD